MQKSKFFKDYFDFWKCKKWKIMVKMVFGEKKRVQHRVYREIIRLTKNCLMKKET